MEWQKRKRENPKTKMFCRADASIRLKSVIRNSLTVHEGAGMDVAAGPEKAQTGKQANEGGEVGRFLHKGAYAQFVSLIDLRTRHSSRIHYDGNMLKDGVFLDAPQNCQAIDNGHAMVEHNHTRLTHRALYKSPFTLQTVQNLLSVVSDDQFVLEVGRLEGAPYK